jgi:hypothetical protein
MQTGGPPAIDRLALCGASETSQQPAACAQHMQGMASSGGRRHPPRGSYSAICRTSIPGDTLPACDKLGSITLPAQLLRHFPRHAAVEPQVRQQ